MFVVFNGSESNAGEKTRRLSSEDEGDDPRGGDGGGLDGEF